MTFSEVLQLAGIVNAVVTPAVLFWLGLRAQTRRRMIEDMDARLKRLDHRTEENARAITVQIAAFQRDVAIQYAQKSEVGDALKDIRDDLRELRNLRNRLGQDD